MNKRILPLFIIIVSALLVASCAGGGVGTSTSWPGVSVSPDGETAYLAYNFHIYAINTENGTQRWRFPQETDNKISFFAAPVLTDDGQLITGGYNNALYSLNPETGSQNWAFENAEGKYIASALVNGERIYAPNADSNLYVLDYKGNLLWTFQTDDEQWGTPVLNGQKIYLPGMDHAVYALDPETGDLIWKSQSLDGAVAGTPAVGAQGELYVGTLLSTMYALNGEDGSTKWSKPVEGWVWSGPALKDETLYFGDLSGTFYGKNTKDGSDLWQPYKLQSESKQGISGTPLLMEDTAYFGSESGAFTALDTTKGTEIWTKPIEGKLYTGPIISGETILLGVVGSDAILYAFDLNGNQIWNFVPQK